MDSDRNKTFCIPSSRRLHVTVLALSVTCSLFPFAIVFAKTPVLIAESPTYPRTATEFSGAVVIDVKSGKRLYAYQADKVWPAASLTKLMTALLVVDRKPRWEKIVTLKREDEVGGGRLRVVPGTRLSIRDLFYSSIVGSANNATMALVRTTGMSSRGFVKKMNARARVLGLKRTTFADPTGMSPRNTSTAGELAVLSRSAFRNSTIKQAAGTSEYQFMLRNTGQEKLIHNTNHLLTRDPDVLVSGGKTGYLLEARNNLVVELSKQVSGSGTAPKLMVVVLGSPDKERMFASAKGLAQWAWKAYRWPS